MIGPCGGAQRETIVTFRLRHSTALRASAIVLTSLSFAGAAQPAAAQNIFEMLFGAFRPPERTQVPFDPAAHETRRADRTGGGTVYCVRTCDGRYFPMQRHAGTSPAEMCRSFCPASKTMVFSGGKIDSAVAANGTRYADLDNAFVYREKMVDNCTCNGRDGLGLAHLDAASDPTLRPGDIVATNEGFATFRDRTRGSPHFTAINPASSEWARKLAETKIRSPASTQGIGAVANDIVEPDLTNGMASSDDRQATR
jgi:hypothetical protein